MESREHRIGIDGLGTTPIIEAVIAFSRKETTLKKDIAVAKSNFTRGLNSMSSIMEKEESSSQQSISDALYSLGNYQAVAMQTMASLSDLYVQHEEMEKNRAIVIEIEKIEYEFSTASEVARDFLDSKWRGSNVRPVSTNVNIDSIKTKQPKFESRTNEEPSCFLENKEQTEQLNIANISTSANMTTLTKEKCLLSSEGANMGKHSVEFETTSSQIDASIGHDMWRQLKKVQIPVFTGDKRKYQSWKAAFIACIDNAPATGDYKLLQLRQYLSGEALQVIENLGHSAKAYVAAKERLERKYGGNRRQTAIYLQELDQFQQVRPGSAMDLEKFADLLDIAIINLQEIGRNQDLGDGLLYAKLQQKLPETMLARYHRWIYENNKQESVFVLRTWVVQESEFMTIASETVNGFTVKTARDTSSNSAEKYGNQHSFFGETTASCRKQTLSCNVCGENENHCILSCSGFLQKSVPDRWNTAKQCRLCFRCLEVGHCGKFCPRSRQCGINGCQKLHHQLLHKLKTTRPQLNIHVAEKLCMSRTESNVEKDSHRDVASFIDNGRSPVTEGKDHPISKITKRTITGLRTVPVLLKNGDRCVKVNALLDDASTQTYVNKDVAAVLGISGKPESVTVNVLNGQAKTFTSNPITVELGSVDGDVSITTSAYTANRVTGNMAVIDWNQFKLEWPHLRNIAFPLPATRPIVDVLIGIDCAELHCALQEVRGRPGEPVARLTPLGWTCISNHGVIESN